MALFTKALNQQKAGPAKEAPAAQRQSGPSRQGRLTVEKDRHYRWRGGQRSHSAFVDRGGGRPVVLAHGFPLDHGMWQAQIEALVRDYRVIAADFRGFGQSTWEKLRLTTRPMAVFPACGRWPTDLAALLNHLALTEPVVLCGLDGRLRGLPVPAGLSATVGGAGAVRHAGGGRHAGSRRRTAQNGRAGGARRPALPYQRHAAQAAVAGYAADAAGRCWQLEQTINACQPRGIAAAARGMAERPDATGWLPEITCPTLVVAGQEDVISPPAEMASIAAAIAGAKFVEIAGAGHMSPLEQPAAVNRALLKFLAGLE